MTRRYLVSGHVQGVGFRWFARRAAVELGLTGWVRNLRDGRVEAEASGPPERLAAFERRLREGPDGAVVGGVDAQEVPEAEPHGRFEIVH